MITCGGGNSPFTNLFPVNGVSANGTGACNADDIQLMPGKLHGGGCGDGADLVLDETRTKLIGVKHGHRVCEGSALREASFVVRSPKNEVELKIANVPQYTDDGPHRSKHEAYLITHGGESVCEFVTARQVLHDLGFHVPSMALPNPPLPAGYTPKDEDKLVVAMAGPIFDIDTAEPIKDPDPAGFFNLACVGDALAKASFYELAGDAQETRAALRMITANYCGARLTVRGVHIEWEKVPKEHSDAVTEAKWAQSGKALCIENPRLMEVTLKRGDIVVPPDQLPAELEPKGCTADSTTSGKCDKKAWIEHLRMQCNVPDVPKSCASFGPPDVRFESRVGPNGSHVILSRPPQRAP